MRLSHHIQSLLAACRSLGYHTQSMDSFSTQVVKVSKGEKSCLIGAGDICAFPTNSATAVEIVKDKSHAINILRQHNFSTPEGEYFFTNDDYRAYRGDGKERNNAREYAQSLGFPLFAKPNNGSRGAFVEKLYSLDDLDNYLARVANHHLCIRLEKPLSGHESRLFVVNGEITFGYQRRSPQLIGDGTSTIAELFERIAATQQSLGKATLDINSTFFQTQLNTRQLTTTSVLARGDSLPFTPAQNLALGGDVHDYREQFSPELQRWAADLATLFSLDVFGVDVYAESDVLTPENMTILELNGNPSLESAAAHSPSNIVERIWAYQLSRVLSPQ